VANDIEKTKVDVIPGVVAQIAVVGAGLLMVLMGCRPLTSQGGKGQPHHITQEQREKFVRALKDAPKGQILVRTNSMGRTKITDYVHEIRSLLDDAGYPGNVETEAGYRTPSNASDVLIMFNSDDEAPGYAANVQRAFKDIGIDAPGYEANGKIEWIKGNDLIVFIGTPR
jgi:hypothetical protein